ncbi:hypothetical protein BN1708_020556, partial [Verticillium longisporum]
SRRWPQGHPNLGLPRPERHDHLWRPAPLRHRR